MSSVLLFLQVIWSDTKVGSLSLAAAKEEEKKIDGPVIGSLDIWGIGIHDIYIYNVRGFFASWCSHFYTVLQTRMDSRWLLVAGLPATNRECSM